MNNNNKIPKIGDVVIGPFFNAKVKSVAFEIDGDFCIKVQLLGSDNEITISVDLLLKGSEIFTPVK